MPNIGLPELAIILVIALLVVGPGKLPDVASALGKSIREFRRAATDVQESAKLDAPIAPVATPAAPVVDAPIAPVATPAAPVVDAPIAPVVAPVVTPVVGAAAPVATPAAPVPNTLAAAATPNELSAPVAPDPIATAAEAATEAKV